MTKLPFQVYLDPAHQDLLEQLSTQLGLSKAQTVREAIRQLAYAFSGDEDPLLQLIGGLDNPTVPADLSTRHDVYAVEPPQVRHVAEGKRSKEKEF